MTKIFSCKIAVLIFFFFLLGGCAKHSSFTVPSGYETEPDYIPSLSELELNDSYQEEIDVAYPGEPDEISTEFEQTMSMELEGLQELGKWEEGEAADEIEEAEVQYDFPITMNKQVEYYLDFFQNKNRKNFTRWLERSGAYVPMIQEKLKEADLPQDLVYLAMIESGFSQTARSRARAVGMWQFIRATGRNYGLTVNGYLDERRDPVKATDAAISYLSELYDEFGSWYLAVAAYNAGEGKIRRAIRKQKSTNFWDLAQSKYLRLETKRYVPKLIAAIIIAKNPEKYGFSDIQYHEPLAFDTISTPRWTALKAVSLACDIDVKTLQSLNRELLRPFTPPDNSSYELRLPPGKKTSAEDNLTRIHAVVSTKYKTHVVKEEDTLTAICRKYGLTKTIILKTNNLHSVKLEAGQRLRIPYRTTEYELLPEGSVAPHLFAQSNSEENFILHKIKNGETVSEIAARYNVPAHLIAGWNDLQDISRIRAGQQLAIYAKQEDDQSWFAADTAASMERSRKSHAQQADGEKPVMNVSDATVIEGINMMTYRVQRGDSLWTIARKFDISMDEIRSWNNLESNIIHPGSTLLIAIESQAIPNIEESDKGIYYFVRGGDSLWTIARKFNQPIGKIRRWNNLKDDVIYPGNRLLVKLAEVDV